MLKKNRRRVKSYVKTLTTKLKILVRKHSAADFSLGAFIKHMSSFEANLIQTKHTFKRGKSHFIE